jgi:paired small multidrug resistance pump
MNWIILILAGLFEIVGVNGMQQIAAGKIKRGLIVLLVGFSISLSLLSIAMETIPLGVAYAVWTGIGTAGSIIIGMLFYNDSADRKRIFYLSFIFIAVIGLRLVTN